MISQWIDWMEISWDLVSQSNDRIIWNLFLAFIPLGLSYYLFRPLVSRNLVWWFVLIIFAAFLPNAPYILTDSIHIIELSHQEYPVWATIFILIPQYVLFIVAGFEAYVICLMKMDNYLIKDINRQYLGLINGVIHGLCVVGIYLGRFERFNSWDLVTKPGKVVFTTGQDLLNLATIFTLAIAFILIWSLAELTKLVNNSVAIETFGNQ